LDSGAASRGFTGWPAWRCGKSIRNVVPRPSPLVTEMVLAIVQSVVSDHHGNISVTSDEGRGTTFRIDLPQRQAGHTTTPREAAPEKKSTPSTLAAASD